MRVSGVYAIVNLATGRRYVGSSVDIPRRWREHLHRLRHNQQPAEAFQREWNEQGEAAFGFVILETVEGGKDALVAREQFHIDATTDLYNVSRRAGTGPRDGFKHCPESVAKMVASRAGYRHTPESRARISAARKGKSCPKHNAALRGRTPSLETRAKMSAARKGVPRSPECIAKSAAARRGRPHAPGTGAHISAAKRGKPWSDAQYVSRGLPIPIRTFVALAATPLASMAECAEAIAGVSSVWITPLATEAYSGKHDAYPN
jgi:group I intron endonuclease